jgi:molybdate transport system substrate-binding protein
MGSRSSRPNRVATLVFSAAVLVAIGSPLSAQSTAPLTVVTIGPVRGALEQLGPLFEKASGHKITFEYDTPPEMARRVNAGGGVDVVLAGTAAVDAFVKSGVLSAESEAAVGTAVASVAFRRGTPRPEIATPEALKTFLLGVKSISYSDPAAGGASSVYFAGVIQRLGISDAVTQKATLTKIGEGAIPAANGQTDFAIAESSEIALQPGLDGVPIFPADPKSKSSFAAAVSTTSAQPEVARAFIRFLLSPDGTAVRMAKGLGAG